MLNMQKSSLLRNGIWVTAGNFSRRFFALFSNLILARLLVPDDFGIVSIAWVFWSFFILFTQNSTSLFILYKGIDEKPYLDTTYTVSLAAGAITSLLLVVSSPIISNFFSEPALSSLLIVYAFNLFLASGYFPYSAVLMRQERYAVLALNTLIASGFRLSFTIGAALLGLRYWSFAIGDMAFWSVEFILVIIRSNAYLKIRLHPEIVREVVSYCSGAIGSSFGFYVNSNLDNFIVGRLLGKASLGYYNLAYQLSMALTTILNPIMNQVGTPEFAKIDKPADQKKALIAVIRQLAYLTTPFYLIIFLILDKKAIAFIFGQNWTQIAHILPWLLSASYFRVINAPLKTMLSARGFPGINAKVNLCIAPIAILSFWMGAKLGNVVGVAISAAVVLGFFWTLLWWWIGCRSLHWPMYEILGTALKPIVFSLLALVLSYAISYWVFDLFFGSKIIIFILTYVFLIYLLSPEQFFEYAQVFKKLVRKLRLVK